MSKTNLISLRASVAAFAIVIAAAIVPAAASAAPQNNDPAQAKLKIKPFGIHKGKAKITKVVSIGGSLAPYRKGQHVRVFFYNDGKKVKASRIKVKKGDGDYGTFKAKIGTREGKKYAVQARYYGQAGSDPVSKDHTVRKSWKVKYVSLSHGQCSSVVKGFRKALNKLRLVPSQGKCFDGQMDRAVLAYRKLNNFNRNSRANKTIVKRIFNGKGGYNVRRPELGVHVEAPLSRQVIVFAKGDKPYAIFPIASGKPSTPTILGTFSFYMKTPGYNSHGMYYSSYFIRGYAIHGYAEVPDYPASHGCLRTFIADQPRIYEMTEYGMPIYVFGDARSISGGFGSADAGPGSGPDLGPTGGLNPAVPD